MNLDFNVWMPKDLHGGKSLRKFRFTYLKKITKFVTRFKVTNIVSVRVLYETQFKNNFYFIVILTVIY